jgi:23S rRNA (pseudouridine1915-N3)-methyltransferase
VKLRVVAVGRLREPALRTLADDYLGRIRRYVRCDEVEVREESELVGALSRAATVVALDVEGEELKSLEFARLIERSSMVGKGDIAFLLGGADGLPGPVLSAAQHRLSLSRLTLPHRLARVLLYEQIYRSFTILRGEPYAREE